MEDKTIRGRLDAYAKEKYGAVPETLPFSHAHYEIYRRPDTGKWYAVFIVKDRQAFGLEGEGRAEILCFKTADPLTADLLAGRPGYLRGYPGRGWNWASVLLDGTVPFGEICHWLDESHRATGAKGKKRKDTPLP